MGLAASQARFLGLTARKSNTEYQGQMVNQSRTALANESADLFRTYVSLAVPTPPDVTQYAGGIDDTAYQTAYAVYETNKATYDAQIANYNARSSVIQEEDRTLELLLKQLDSEQEALQTEMESVKKVIDKNIDSTFKTFA